MGEEELRKPLGVISIVEKEDMQGRQMAFRDIEVVDLAIGMSGAPY